MTGTGRERGLSGRVALSLLAVFALPGAGASQSVGAGTVIQSFRFNEPETTTVERFDLFVAPWAADVPVGDFRLSARGAYAHGRVRAIGGAEASMQGITDTDLTVSYAPRAWLVVRADATLPTGRSALSVEEGFVAGFVAAELLPLAIRTWGSGPMLGGTVAVAKQVGAWGVGAAAGYHRSSTFEPVPGAPIGYDPGDQLHVRLALDRDVATSSTLSMVLAYQRYADDKVLGTNLFQAGSRLQGVVSLAFPVAARSSALVLVAVNHRSAGAVLLGDAFFPGTTDTPTQQLYMTAASMRIPLGRRAALLPQSEVRLFRSGDGASQGWLASGGVAIDVPVAGTRSGGRVVLSPSGHLRTGTVLVLEGLDTGFKGWEAGLTLRFEGGR